MTKLFRQFASLATLQNLPGIIMHEEISEGLFDEINNVLETNRLLAAGERGFVFGDDIYYRVYAERQHVQSSQETFMLLARTALERVYGPSFFWLLRLQPSAIAKPIIRCSLILARRMFVWSVDWRCCLGAPPATG